MIAKLALALALAAPVGTPLSAQAGGGAGRGGKVEQRVRQRIAAEVRSRLSLSDDQFAKLSASNRKFDEQRRLLVEQERDVRLGLREEVLKGKTANQARVSELIDRALGVQRRRLEITAEEQRELAGFLTPVQRAQYLGLQESVRRRIDEMRRRRFERGPGKGDRTRRP